MSGIQRRNLLAAITGGFAAGAGGLIPWHVGSAVAQEDLSVDNLYVNDQLDDACNRAVEYLISNQRTGSHIAAGSITDRGHEVALTALAIMAMAAVGTEPSEPTRNGRAMRAAIDFVLRAHHQTDSGYLGQHDGSRMYGHGIATLMLTEMLGMGATVEQNNAIHDRLEHAIRLILASQAVPKARRLQGGWRYTPGSPESDLSVSIWQLMALRSAKNDGLDVPAEAIESALEYLRNSFTGRFSGQGSGSGGFSYTPGQTHPSFTMTAAGLLAMQVCGEYDAKEVAAAANWLLQNEPKVSERYLFYGLYYYAQGMYQAGGKFNEEARKVVASLLLPRQRRDGSWMSPSGEERNVGMVYSTSLAILSLSVRYHYLPIYQR
ncbi:terpene cyclase/mutase family protein [Stieleria sp. JC731]|uniref:prenyltransferase/squalene oxidase repeat-containing protein n=1 Tax=Pirellulaceae TaxID=2691357 RepID=UPI001E4DE48B|nr:prenyltransferase/squalene oxidase repeat-containing protein [Stieleria sp. JC731]MCC9603295.1 terpene cyclase/mutase family protein [Stieleria sp. JC731]